MNRTIQRFSAAIAAGAALILSTPLFAQWTYHPIQIPMRDGKYLAADLYALDTTVAKPVILVQTPYNKIYYRLRSGIPGAAGGAGFPVDSLAYNYVTLDWRGKYASKDAATQGVPVRIGVDGYDAVEWIATQPWCNGKVATWGPSALAEVQFQTAKEQPPHLVCCVPLVHDYQTMYTDYFYGGVYRREQIEAMQTLGFLTTDLILSRPLYSPVWNYIETTTDYPDKIKVPMLIIGGWFDHYPDGVLQAFKDIRERSDAAVRPQHKLIYGPWLHGACVGEKQGILSYPNAASTAPDEGMRFFDYYLRGAKNGWPLEPPVRYYQLGVNEWREADDWHTLPKKDYSLYLQSGGVLSEVQPATSGESSFAYDPRDPSPSIGYARFTPGVATTPIGPQDQAPVEVRNDNLIFTTPVLTSDLEIDGAVRAELFVSSDRTDTDIAIRLCDVFPDNTSIIMCDGIKRMRLRDSYETESLLTPGNVYPVTVELPDIALTVQRGHRLRIIVTSSNFPRYDLNTNSGGTMYVEGDTLVASNTVHIGGVYPSRIVLPQPAITGVEATQSGIPFEPSLEVYPVPASTTATISLMLPSEAETEMVIFDAFGRKIATAYSGRLPEGRTDIGIREIFPPGLYLVRAKCIYFGSIVKTVTTKLLLRE